MKDDADLVAHGEWGDVRHAQRLNGCMEASEWLREQTNKVKASLDHLFRKMAAFGRIQNKQHFRDLRDGIYEFKRGPHRILCFQVQRCWRLTHYYNKGGQSKCPPRQIDHAIAIRTEFLLRLSQRQGNGK